LYNPWFAFCVSTMPDSSPIEQASLTDIGCQRENNQDRQLFWMPQGAAELERKGCLAVVADGMGGYDGGQDASRIAVETVQRLYVDSSADPQSSLYHAVVEAHRHILDFAAQNPGLRGMGTTCTAMAVVGSQVFFAHVGDSRLYLLRGAEISRLTRDHSYVTRLVESGAISEEEAETHSQRHILTAALGAGDVVSPDIPSVPILLEAGDTMILCSDGLWGQVKDQEIASIVKDNPLAEACRKLVQLARERGGPDNITVQMVRLAPAKMTN
jgi:serine/threonine protein phosphatase PrpC